MLCRRGRALTASHPRGAGATSKDCRAIGHVSTRQPNGAVPPTRPLGRSRNRGSAGRHPPQRTLRPEVPFALALTTPDGYPYRADPNLCPTRSTPHAPRCQLLSSSASPTFVRSRATAAAPRPSHYHFPFLDPVNLRSRGRSPLPVRTYSSQAIPSSSSPSQTFCSSSTSHQPPPSKQNTMTANKLDGTAIAKAVRERLRVEILEKQETNPRYKPCLKIIQGARQQVNAPHSLACAI